MAKPTFTPSTGVAEGEKVQAIHVTNLETAVEALITFLPEDFISEVKWAEVTGKPTTFPPTTGATASVAAPGNHSHAVTADAGSGLAAAATIQALAIALSTRIKALEDAGA